MKKASEEIIQEVRKRQPDKPLSLTELAQLREIQYMYLKKEQCVQDLLVHYCRDQRFQIRVCEKAFLMTTIVPLLQFKNPVDVIKNGAKLIACLSENEETHKKIIKSDALRTLAALIEIQLHHDITRYGLKTIANLCRMLILKNKKQLLITRVQCSRQTIPSSLGQQIRHVRFALVLFQPCLPANIILNFTLIILLLTLYKLVLINQP